jgi:hypothetical protein
MIIHQSIVATYVTYFRFDAYTFELRLDALDDNTERERSISSSHKMKQNREYIGLFFADFFRSFVINEFLC